MRFLPSLALVFFAGKTYASYRDFGIPVSSATVDVRVFNVANVTFINKAGGPSLIEPILPGREALEFSAYAFLVEHKTSRLMFDLGTRADPKNYAPSIAGFFSSGILQLQSPAKDIFELLREGGIALNSINTVIWSHAHFDHVGDMSKFPSSTKLVIGSETDTQTYPQFPNASLLASDFAGRTVTKLNFAAANLSFANLKAIDYFGDGSFYLLDTPGHLPGHLSALARVTPTSFVHLAGDTYHNVGEMRPRPEIQQSFPCPAHLLDEAKAVSTDYFWSPKSDNGNFDLRSRAAPLLVTSDLPESFTSDPIIAGISADKVAAFDADPDFFVVVAHDISLRSSLPYFPQTLGTWKANKLKQNTVWNFLDKTNPAFIFNPINQTKVIKT
ncbi:beta-lactamase-like protein [Mycena metata]|uniref:Beta-lactamase-like protein n=1 Tax=Mycena metata TaxID=1033252 RepID=A0AAD7J9M1_9AGAR|nr:beta-lactamase-like protein [Mycena metata]